MEKHVLIVGGGAAGLFAAGTALRCGLRVSVVEHMPILGKKLLITGKGRCNVTNNCDEATFLKNIRRNPRFLYSAIYTLPPAEVMRLFEEELGVPLKTERGGRVFPVSDRAEDIRRALLGYAGLQNANMRQSKAMENAEDGPLCATLVQGRAVELLIEQGRIAGVRLEDGRRLEADAVLVATGGISYPDTGSTGIGYRLAQQAGHTVVEPVASLVPMVEEGTLAKRMMGLSLKNVALTLLEDGKRVFSEQGEMLFTHFGLSGPLVLSASAYLGNMQAHRYEVSIDLKPALDMEKLDARLLRDFKELQNKDVAHGLDKLVPKSMREGMLELWAQGQPGFAERKVNAITRQERRRLCALLKDLRIPIRCRGDLRHAVITAGGVDVREVFPKTMQSKKLPGLYFAGEVLDIDGYTGGYNLQAVWCTAYAAAYGIAAEK